MRHEDLPERWKQRVVEHALEESGGRWRTLSASSFSSKTVAVLRFDDGSTAKFNYPLLLQDDEEICLLTEHCGYHIFTKEGATISLEPQKQSV